MKAEDLLHKLLEIEAPWQVTRVRDDLGRGQIDVWVGEQPAKGGWLFAKRTVAVADGSEASWRHINLGSSRCVVHADADSRSANLGWRGEVGQPFTHAMARLIVGLMRDGIRLQSICAMLDITVGDLWRFKHRLDSGKTGVTAAPALAVAEAATRIPDADAPIWIGLLDASINIEIRVLGLKLLLTKMREQMRLISDAEVRMLKCHELQRFFVRNEKMLAHEIGQIEKLA